MKLVLFLALTVAVCMVNAMPQRQFRQQRQQFQGNNNQRFNNNNNNNNRGGGDPNYRHVEPIYAFGLDTSSGQYAKFNGPVKGIPAGHGGGRFGKKAVYLKL